jgi:hypothetical protein
MTHPSQELLLRFDYPDAEMLAQLYTQVAVPCAQIVCTVEVMEHIQEMFVSSKSSIVPSQLTRGDAVKASGSLVDRSYSSASLHVQVVSTSTSMPICTTAQNMNNHTEGSEDSAMYALHGLSTQPPASSILNTA